MKSWFRKWWWLCVGIVLCIISGFTPQIIDWLYPRKGVFLTVTTFKKEPLLSFYGSFLAFLGTVALGALALWQNIKANDISSRLLVIEEQNNTPYLEILRDLSFISKKNNVLRLGVCVHNISKMPLHNIKLIVDGIDFDFGKDYNEANFHKWMVDIARNFNYDNCKSVNGSCVHFVASMSESQTNTRKSIKNGETTETITAKYSDLARFYFDYNIASNFNHAIQIKFIMENINRVKYIQTSELYIYIDKDKYSIMNHSTNVELFNNRNGQTK